MNKTLLAQGMLALGGILMAACQATATPSPLPPVVQTVVVTKTIQEEDTIITQIIAPTPMPSPPRTLTICVAREPENLFLYGEDAGKSKNNILEAIYDGPIDEVSYQFQPVILEKIPSLADGDARLRTVSVKPGETIVNNSGSIASLTEGVQYRPPGCRESSCAVTYQGDAASVKMEQLEVTFKLLPEITWSDGTPLTASDSVYSFHLAQNPAFPTNKAVIQHTASYQALDESTVQWVGLPGYKDAHYAAYFWSPLPEHQWEDFDPGELLNLQDNELLPIGWGPYQIEEWIPGIHIRLRKNPHYFRASENLPVFEHLIYRFVGDDPIRTIPMLLSGECDVLEETPRLLEQSEFLLALQDQGQLQAVFASRPAWEHVDFGIFPASFEDGWTVSDDRPDFFGDVRTRRALAFCMDRQRVVDNVLFGQSAVLQSYVPPEHPLFNANVQTYPFNLDAGAELLDEIGWIDDDANPATPRIYAGNNPQIPAKTPLSFEFWTSNTPHRQQSAELLAQSMAACGIQANLRVWNVEEFFIDGPDGPLFGRYFDVALFAWLSDVVPPCYLWTTDEIPGNPDTGFGGWDGVNNTGFSDPEYDAVCKAAQTALPGEPGYAENHLRAQEIFADQLPIVPLYQRLKVAVTRPDMCNFVMDATTSSELFNLEAFDYGENCSD